MIKAKICGITNAYDANLSIALGAWAIGFNFVKKSPRYISFAKAKKIVKQLPGKVITVGILINYSEKEVINALSFLDLIQVYETSCFLDAYKSRVILSLSSDSDMAIKFDESFKEYAYILFDAPYLPGQPLGGTGRKANWPTAKKLAKKSQLILAGGINSQNIIAANSQVLPFAVDLASGVELKPGLKSQYKLKTFFKRCNNDS